MPTAKAAKGARRLPRCSTCDRPIRIPKGWSVGAAVRRHYWAKHRAVMLPDRSSRAGRANKSGGRSSR